MRTKIQKSLALFLALAMSFSLLGTTAWATETVQTEDASTSAPAAEEPENNEEKPTTEEPKEKTPKETEEAKETKPATEAPKAKVKAKEAKPAVEEKAENKEPDQAAASEGAVSPQAADAATSGTRGENLTWTLEDGTLTISGTGAMPNWGYYPPPWRDRCLDIKEVIIEYGVTSIGRSAFDVCRNMTSVTIPESVTTIGESAFDDCRSLTGVTIPCSVASVGKEAFRGCQSLKSVYISDLAAWCKCNFANNSANPLSRATNLYLNGTLVKEVVVPDSVARIGCYAFASYNALTSVTIPDSVTTICSGAFDDCVGLTSVTIPDSVTDIGNSVFSGCSNLTSVTISDNITSISSSMFSYCTRLTSVTIPNSVTSISAYAFSYCRSLASVTIPSGVTNIGGLAFKDCESLTSVKIPEGVTSIGDSVFESCSSLTNVTIPDSVTSIGDSVFESCSSLTSVTIPEGVTSIGTGVFCWCDSLKEISVGEDNKEYCSESGVLFDKEKTKLISYPGGKDGSTYTIPASVTSIGDSAFSGCSSLTSMMIPASVTSIGGSAFYGCSSLASVTISASVTSIGYSVFYGCSSLTSMMIPASVTSIGGSAFYGCSNLTSVTIPDSVTSIGNSAFKNCNSLTDVYYTGSEENWNEISIISGNTCLTNATIHYNSTGGELQGDSAGSIKYFKTWDAEKQIAYFGSMDVTGSQVTEQTDTAFLDQVDSLVGHYVLVKTQTRTDGQIAPDTLLSIQPVDTKAGTITAASGNKITIAGTEYTLSEALVLPDTYVGKFVLYHVLQDGSVRVQDLKTETGTLTAWNADTKKLTIEGKPYQLGQCADEASVSFLGDTKYTSIYVQYLHDDLQYVYKIEKTLKPTESNYYETSVPESDEVQILRDYSAEWDRAYSDYIEAVQNALRAFSGTEGEQRETIVNAEAQKMRASDEKSDSTYITTAESLGDYSEYAYKAVAEYLYDHTCDHIELTSADNPTAMVKDVMKGFNGGTKTYHYDNGKIKATISGLLASGSKFGRLIMYDNEKKVVDAMICSTQSEVQASVSHYVNELKDLAKDSAMNIANAVIKDVLGKSLSGLTESYLNECATKIEKRLAVKLTEKFDLAGVGNLFRTINECYSYYTYVKKNLDNLKGINDIEKVLNAVEELEFKDASIKDDLVRKALKKLQKANEQFVKAYRAKADFSVR